MDNQALQGIVNGIRKRTIKRALLVTYAGFIASSVFSHSLPVGLMFAVCTAFMVVFASLFLEEHVALKIKNFRDLLEKSDIKANVFTSKQIVLFVLSFFLIGGLLKITRTVGDCMFFSTMLFPITVIGLVLCFINIFGTKKTGSRDRTSACSDDEYRFSDSTPVCQTDNWSSSSSHPDSFTNPASPNFPFKH
jgi:hypothetical protein